MRPSSGLWGRFSQARFWVKGLLVALFLLLLLALLVSLKVEEVVCLVGGEGVCPDEVKSALYALKGKPMLFLGWRDLVSPVQDRFSFIRSVEVRARFPKTAEVVIRMSKPVVAIINERGPTDSAWYLIDSQGILVEQSIPSPSLPRLRLPESEWRFANHKLNSVSGNKALPILFLLGAKYSGVEAQLNADGDLEARLAGLRVLFSLEKDPSISVATLQLALNEPTILENRPKLIDLRFQNTVLSY